MKIQYPEACGMLTPTLKPWENGDLEALMSPPPAVTGFIAMIPSGLLSSFQRAVVYHPPTTPPIIMINPEGGKLGHKKYACLMVL